MSVALMAEVVSTSSPLVRLMQSLYIGDHSRVIELDSDDNYQENVEFVRDKFGDGIEIMEPDMPPIHDGCGLEITPDSFVAEVDTAMKLAYYPAFKRIKEMQEKNGGYISWKKMQQVFDSDLAAVFTPVVKDNKHRLDHLGLDRGFEWTVPGTSTDPLQFARAEEKMQEVVGDFKVYQMLKIDVAALQKMYATTGTTSWIGSENVAKIAIDIGVIRFPIVDDPFFKIYRFRVIAVRCAAQFIILNMPGFNGLFMVYDERKYRACDAWKAKWQQKTEAETDAVMTKMMSELGF